MIAGGRVNLHVADIGRAVRFYVETLGMKLARESGDAATIDAGEGFQIHVVKAVAPTTTSTSTSIGLRVVKIDHVVPVLENRGVVFERSSARASFSDPDGNALYLYED